MDSALDSGEGAGGLTLINSGVPPPMFVVAYCKSESDRLDVWRFRSIGIHDELVEL